MTGRYECQIVRSGDSYLAVAPYQAGEKAIVKVFGGRANQSIEEFRSEVQGLIAKVLAEQGKQFADARKVLDAKGFNVRDIEERLEGMSRIFRNPLAK